MSLTDTHTHLYLEQFKDDIDVVVQRALDENITRFFLPNIDSTSIDDMLRLCGKYPDHCYPMMGLHPCSVEANNCKELNIVEKQLAQQKFCAIGEIGIDLYWEKKYYKEQVLAFEQQIAWAKEIGLPIVIHCRNSFDEIYKVLIEHQDENLFGIFHCFSGSLEQAQKVIDLGFILGIGGVVTFKNSGLDKVVKDIPIEYIVLETDSPYLAPVPYRGKRNESAYIKIIGSKIADLHTVSLEKIAKKTTENACRVFGLGPISA